MTHYSHVLALAVALSFPIACDKASDDQGKTTGAEVKANNEITATNERAAQADRAARAAENNTIEAANNDFARLRADYRTKTQESLRALDGKVSALEARSTNGIDARLKEIRTERIQFDTDLDALGSATESTWDAQKAALDKKLVDMNALAERKTPAPY